MKKRYAAILAALALAGAGVTAASAATVPAAPTTYNALTPTRVLDTRVSGHPVAPGKDYVLAFPGVPAGATAVAINLTETQPTTGGYLTVTPDGAKNGLGTSTLNFGKGQTSANGVTATLAADGKVDIWNQSTGTVHIIVDLLGYYTAPAAAPTSTVWNLEQASQGESVATGGSAWANATSLGSLTLPAGTYLVTTAFTATPNAATAGPVFPQLLFTLGGPLAKGYATSVFNVGAGQLEQATAGELSSGDLINSSYSGTNTVTLASSETLYFYAFGYDGDTGAGSYALNAVQITATPLNVS